MWFACDVKNGNKKKNHWALKIKSHQLMFTPQTYMILLLINLHQHTYPLFPLQFHKQWKILFHNKQM